MKGNDKIVSQLNKALGLEYGAVIQYITHSAMFENDGYHRIGSYLMDRAKQEMSHADRLLEHILFLEGTPQVGPIGINIGKGPQERIQNDLLGEQVARVAYNELIDLCITQKDGATAHLIEQILTEEEEHINSTEEDLKQIAEMGLALFLSVQVVKP